MWQARAANNESRDYTLDDIMLLKVGRHIRPKETFKIIVSREEGENHYLSGYRKEYITLQCTSHPGPLAMIDGEVTPDDITLAARIVARFGKARDAESASIEVRTKDGVCTVLEVAPMPAHEVPKEWYV